MRQDVESFEDFIQYYSLRFVKSRTHGEMFYIRGRDVGQTVLTDKYVHGRLAQQGFRIPWSQIPSMVYFGLPRLGTVAYNHELLFLYYRPRRHGGRGYDSARIRFSSFNGRDLKALGLPTFDKNLLTYAPFVHLSMIHNHTPWGKATDELFSDNPKTPVYALSFNFGIFLPASKEYPVLTYKTSEIGDVVSPSLIRLKPKYSEHDALVERVVPSTVEIRV